MFTFLDLVLRLSLVIAAAAIMGGLFFAYPDYARAMKQDSWVSSTARIAKLQVEQEHQKDRNGNISTYYTPKIYYEYKTEKGKHTGLFNPTSIDDYKRGPVDAYMTRFHLGDIINAYYDPKNPDTSVVIRADKEGARNLLMQFAAAFVGSVLVLIWGTGRNYRVMTGLRGGAPVHLRPSSR